MQPAPPLAPPRPGRRGRRLVAALVVATVVLVVAQATGMLGVVRDGARLADWVRGLGWPGPVALVALMTLLVPVGVPGVPFVLAAAVVWSPPVAIATCLVGGTTSSAIGLLGARRLGRDVLAARMPAWLRGVDDLLTRGGLVAVVVLRVVLYLAAPADWAIGLSRVPMRTALVGTVLGLVPVTVAYVLVGPEFFGWLASGAGSSALVVAAGLAWGTRRVLRRRRPARADGSPG